LRAWPRRAQGAWQNRPVAASSIRILGVDPGLNRTGWGVIEVRGSALRCVDHGVIRVPPGELPPRLGFILASLGAVIERTAPQMGCVEKVFVNVNPQSTLLLGQARGAALCALVAAGLPVGEHTALQVKQAVVGYGKASKQQVQMMVTRLLALATEPSTDAADALACAICAAHQRRPAAAEAVVQATAAATSASVRRGRGRTAWRDATYLIARSAEKR
jgi:crossover junction endodeoxyribonuclease RuvC